MIGPVIGVLFDGFASTVAGNPVSFEDEVKKLELVVETARTVWGTA
jgi:hypothetical protein